MGKNNLSTGAGFLPSTISSAHCGHLMSTQVAPSSLSGSSTFQVPIQLLLSALENSSWQLDRGKIILQAAIMVFIMVIIMVIIMAIIMVIIWWLYGDYMVIIYDYMVIIMVIIWWLYGDYIWLYGDYHGDYMVVIWWLYGDYIWIYDNTWWLSCWLCIYIYMCDSWQLVTVVSLKRFIAVGDYWKVSSRTFFFWCIIVAILAMHDIYHVYIITI